MTKYIDVEQAIETFKKVLPIPPRSCGKTNIYIKWILALSEAWNNIPSADVQPVVHGKWIKVDEQPYFRKHFHTRVCSVCRMKKDGNWNYCPNCGADMRVENE